jgi:hypothetical protein
MFLLWTIGTTWFLLIFDSAWFERPIKDHSISTLFQVLMPTSLLEWLVIASWIIPLLIVATGAFFTQRLQRLHRATSLVHLFPGLSSSGMQAFDWVLLLLVLALAVVGWTIQMTALLLPCTIIAIGMVLNKFERG